MVAKRIIQIGILAAALGGAGVFVAVAFAAPQGPLACRAHSCTYTAGVEGHCGAYDTGCGCFYNGTGESQSACSVE